VQEEVRAVATRDDSGRASRHEDEVKSLTAQISFLDEEIAVLRRRLADSPRQVRLLEDRLRETEGNSPEFPPRTNGWRRPCVRHATRSSR